MSDSYAAEENFHDEWARSIHIDRVMVDELFDVSTAPENRFIIQNLGRLKGKKVLDLGCGGGEASVYFAQKGALVTAMDISSEMLNVVKKLAQKYNVTVLTSKCSSDAIDTEDEIFDIIYTANLLHHVNIKATLKEVHRVLKTGGIFASWDPLAHNPIINIYRKLAVDVRTEDEHPLRMRDLMLFHQHFSEVQIHMTWFFSLWIFIKFYLFERVDPNKERYWKKILVEHDRLQRTYCFLEKLDHGFLDIFPFMKRFCWNVTVIAKK